VKALPQLNGIKTTCTLNAACGCDEPFCRTSASTAAGAHTGVDSFLSHAASASRVASRSVAGMLAPRQPRERGHVGHDDLSVPCAATSSANLIACATPSTQLHAAPPPLPYELVSTLCSDCGIESNAENHERCLLFGLVVRVIRAAFTFRACNVSTLCAPGITTAAHGNFKHSTASPGTALVVLGGDGSTTAAAILLFTGA
jgi:hypothetical protein